MTDTDKDNDGILTIGDLIRHAAANKLKLTPEEPTPEGAVTIGVSDGRSYTFDLITADGYFGGDEND